MMENTTPTPLPTLTDEARIANQVWWDSLSDDWKKAFNQAVFQKGEVTDTPTPDQLHQLHHIEVVRLTGPKALYPNLSFEIGNLDGIERLKNLVILVVIDSGIKSLQALSQHKRLKSLFVFNNRIRTLTGVENLTNLEQFYFQDNQVVSLEPLKKLTNLKEVYASRNELTSLSGITEEHSDNLVNFRILPNKNLRQREVIKMENQLGIRCLQG